MFSLFKSNLSENFGIRGHETFILAVSGGIDSVCMAHLFFDAGLKFSVAHCNYGLRGEESDGDELLVKQLAEKFEVPFYTIHFNTREYAQLQKVGIQVAARELRYNWFENLRRKYNYDYVAVAHNADDSIETFFINLARGCGINGITGIKALNGKVIRPLLFASRADIEAFCTEKKINYRTDSSNLTDKYLRNRFRNHMIPEFEKEIPDFKKIMHENLKRLEDASILYNYGIERIIYDIVDFSDANKILVSISKLLATPAPHTVLFEILKKYDFSAKTCDDVFSSLNGISGKTFASSRYRLVKDREDLILYPLNLENNQKFFIDADTVEIQEPFNMKFSFHSSERYEFSKNKGIADFDAEQLVFPLMLRRWQHGDYFRPLGLKSFKKLSDFFTDKKLSLYDKENCWILTSAGEIVWIIGHRIDDRFKITENTQKVYQIEVL